MPQADGPHGRIGFVWAAATALIVLLGAVPAGAWMAVHAALAVVQVERTWGSDRRSTVAAAVGSGLFAFACSFGLVGAAVGAALAASVAAVSTAQQGDGRVRARTVAAALLFGAAAGSIPLARSIGPVPGVFLLGLMAAHDTGNYIVGTGANNAWEGTAAGIAAMGPVTLLGATLAVPPLTEAGPWILGALAVPLTPLGPFVGAAVLGRSKSKSKKVRVPAVRRLDALLLLGPVWAVAAHALTQ